MLKIKYYIIASLCLFIASLLLTGCEKEASLSSQSVVDLGASQREKTELDDWISERFTLPHGIEVEYRWEKNASQSRSFTYPPQAENVKSVLETIKKLWIDLYTDTEIGGEKFLLGKSPLKIYMYGGKNVDGNGMELLGNSEATANEMFLYDVNNFDPKDENKVFRLMRSVHYQFARRLMEVFPYERNKFLSISNKKYLGTTKTIADQSPFLFYKSPNRLGFLTPYSLISVEDDFAEFISVKLTYPQKEILKFFARAKTPSNAGSDPELQLIWNENARLAHKELVEKQAFVEDYFKKEVKISLNYLQMISVKKMKAFTRREK